MVTSEQLIEKLTIELGNMLTNNISLGLQVDDLNKQLEESNGQKVILADRNIELQSKIDKDRNVIASLKAELDKAGLRANKSTSTSSKAKSKTK